MILARSGQARSPFAAWATSRLADSTSCEYNAPYTKQAVQEEEMQTILDVPTNSRATVSQADAQRAAGEYVTRHIDPSFTVVSGFLLMRDRPQWRFILRSPYGPLGYLRVDAETGAVMALTADELRIVQERALIAEAESRDELPLADQGYVPAEYARRRANGYLTDQLSLHYSASEGAFVPLDRPVWRFAIRFRLPRLSSPSSMGTLDVDAQTGEPITLTPDQLQPIRDRTHALIRGQPLAPTN
jgi:hypothetical protein